MWPLDILPASSCKSSDKEMKKSRICKPTQEGTLQTSPGREGLLLRSRSRLYNLTLLCRDLIYKSLGAVFLSSRPNPSQRCDSWNAQVFHFKKERRHRIVKDINLVVSGATSSHTGPRRRLSYDVRSNAPLKAKVMTFRCDFVEEKQHILFLLNC